MPVIGAFIAANALAIAITASAVSAVFSVIQAFTPPKPTKITFGLGGGSPTYGTFILNNTISNEFPVPVLYGTLLVGGNLIWQSDPASTVYRLIGICEGQISAIGSVKANAILINATNMPGSSFTSYLGTSSQDADSRLPASLRPDLAFHNLAYLALTLATSDSLKGGDPTITSICDGTLVETWDGTQWLTAKSFSRNPVACIRDFLLSARYGLGIPKANLNDTTFGEIYDYCEGLVDTAAGKEARFRLDFIIDAQKPAQDVLNEMLATFGGFLVYAGNKIKMRCDKIDPIIQYFGDGSTTKANAQFDPNNIVRDSFSWNMASVDDRPNRIKIQWVDPSQNHVKVYTQVEDRIDQDDRATIITKEVALLGITRQTQAARMAKFMMSVSKYSHINVSFASRLESIQCEVGDVVALTHQAGKFIRRLLRIVDMQESEDETIMFTCRDYNASIYDDHQGAAIITYTQPSGPNPYAPLSDVTALTTSEANFVQKDGVFATNILASWTALSDEETLRLDKFLVQISSDGGVNYRDVAFVSAQKNSYRIVLGNVQTGTTFVVRIKTISDKGAQSVGVTSSITIQGKRTPPSDVQNFTVTFAFDHIAMAWSAINDQDLFGYEIRSGDSTSIWETATIVTTENLGTRFDLFNFTRGTKKFYIKAIDNSQNYSQNAAVDTVTISSIPDSNITFSFDIFSRLTVFTHPLEGTLSASLDKVATNDFDATYNRIVLQPKATNTWLSLQNAGGTWLGLQSSSFSWGNESFVTTQETYQTTAIDIGVLTTGSYILDIRTFSSSNLGFVGIQMATSTDGITFTAYKDYVAGSYSARYVKFQFLIQATNASTKVRLISAIITIDVPDIHQTLLNQSISAGGRTFYLTGFTSVKSVVMTTVGSASSLLSPQITDQSGLPNSFVARMFDKTDAGVAGSVNIYLAGY